MKKAAYWLLAIIITIVLSVYQRMTGPTNPKRISVELADKTYKMKLPRSGVQEDKVVALKEIPQTATSQVHYRRYPTNDGYTTQNFQWTDGEWQTTLPVQPVGGKLQYYITIEGTDYPTDEPVIIRFRNDVPAGILIPHIFFMFASMLFAVYTLLLIIRRRPYAKWLKITVGTLFVGGFIFGPLVQHTAFGPWWTGFPIGMDLTDNKTLIAFVAFLIALATLKWRYNKWVVTLAVLLMIAIFTIPHSTHGSEYNYEKQELSTGS